MLESLRLQNFTRFDEAEFKFAKNLNVLVGENGTGKTHVLKVAYGVIAAGRKAKSVSKFSTPIFNVTTEYAAKLFGVFRPDFLGSLVRQGAGQIETGFIDCRFDNPDFNLKFSIASGTNNQSTTELMPKSWEDITPVFLPTRELLTISPGFLPLYENTYIPFEETWRDTISLLQASPVKGQRETKIRELLAPLEVVLGGRVEATEGGRFYLTTNSGRLEMHLVAEGLRKLAMVALLIATGSLLDKGYLFWDEPESNMNPKIVKDLARIILLLAQNGIQVFIATHSLFLLRELYILQETEFKELDSSYFGLHIQEGGEVQVQQGATMDDIGDIAALDEQLSQSDRYLETEEMLSQKAH